MLELALFAVGCHTLEPGPVVGAVEASARRELSYGFGEMVLDVLHSGRGANGVKDAWQIFR